MFAEKGNYETKDRLNLFIKIKEDFSKFFRLVDIRIASNHIEVDVICYDIKNLKVLEKFFKISCIRDLSVDTKVNPFFLARYFFNKERFWEVHEILEGVWRKKESDEKRILHGLILLAASYVHLQRGREQVAISVLQRAFDELKDYNERYEFFEINKIKDRMKDMLEKRKMIVFKI
ncbi:MAG: DUF309 domain-containing protein [Thermoproteota archaeon]